MNSLNKRYCVSSVSVVLLMLSVTFFSFANFRNMNSYITENSTLLKNDICVVRMTEKKKAQKIVQNPVKEKDVVTQKIKQIPEPENNRNVHKTETAEEESCVNENPAESSEVPDENGSPDSAVLSESVKSYKSYVLNRIAGKKTYPLSARKKGYEGKVKIHLVIDSDGEILTLEVCEPCEFDVLNNAALKSVEKAAPFKKMKDIMTSLDFIFTLDFKLSS